MFNLPKHATCGDCKTRVKLKIHRWELWTDHEDRPVGVTQQRTCHKCRALVFHVIGNEDFCRTLSMHYGAEFPEPMH